MKLKINFSDCLINKHLGEKDYLSFQHNHKFINYFFPEYIKYDILNNNNNVCIYSIYLDDNNKINKNNINILICIENAKHHTHYDHYNKYGEFNDEKIDIYFYNHIDKIIETKKYIAIPVIYTQINYFNLYYKNIQPSIYTPYNQKKFCLFVSNNDYLIHIKNKIKTFLKSIDECDSLEIYNKEIKNKSCYHSIEFLNVLNQYKFIFVCENSIEDGYITEKIFNCFFARCIPIYYGSKNINKYINENCFINMNDIENEDDSIIKNRILEISNNETIFNENINNINNGKCVNTYDDENYKERLKIFLKKISIEKNINLEENIKYNKIIIYIFIFIILFILIFGIIYYLIKKNKN